VNVLFFNLKNQTFVIFIDNTTHRHSLYESASQNSVKVKRTETVPTVHSTGRNNITFTPKKLATNDRRSSKEGKTMKSH